MCRWLRLRPGIRAWSPARRGGRGQGLGSPSPPTTPYPALRQPLLAGSVSLQASLASSLSRGIGQRPPAVPALPGRACGRRRSFRPCGAAISSAPCRACAGKRTYRSFRNEGQPCLSAEERGFPLVGRRLYAGCGGIEEKSVRSSLPRDIFALGRRLRPGMRSWSPARRGGRGQGLAQPLVPYTPLPRGGTALLAGLHDCTGRPPVSSLPRGIGQRPPAVLASPERASGRRRSFRPYGRRSPPRHAALAPVIVHAVPSAMKGNLVSLLRKGAFPWWGAACMQAAGV